MGSVLSRGKISRRISLFAVVVLMAALWANAGPTVTVVTDRGIYYAGETILLSLGGENHDESMSVDVYVGLVGHDGALYTLSQGSWGAYLEPWMADLLVPNPFYMAPVAFQWFVIPCAMPPIGEQGEYSFAAGLTRPATFDFVSDISFAPFSIEHPDVHIYVSAQTGDDANDGSEDSPFKTITRALASVSGSEAHPVTIHVAAGTYAKSTNGETFPLNMKSWVSLIGEDRKTAILDAEYYYSTSVVSCDNVDNVTIEGLTITRGSLQWASGGGIYCSSSNPRIQGNIISLNGAKYGGGIYCGNGSSPTIENNSISDNWSGAEGQGGGIYCSGSSAPNIKNNLIIDNSAYRGGALYYHAESPPVIENNTMSENSARYGAGIYCMEPARSLASSATIPTCVTSRPERTALPEGAFNIFDCIIWGNSTSSRYAYDDDGLYRDLYCCSAVYSCIEQEEKGEGNIHYDPMFVSGMFGPYYLDPQSPCVDAGSRSAAEARLSLWTTQADGMPDVGNVDMGCHRLAALSDHPPTAHIDLISPNPVTQGAETVQFSGHGESNGYIIDYRWLSDLNGYLSGEQHFAILHAAHLTPGTHEISLLVRDSETGWSQLDTAELIVLPNPRDKVFVSAEAGDDLNYGSELDPFKTITHALGCVHGTEEKPVTAHIAVGTYSASTNGESFPLNMKSWVSVIGEGSDTTTLDAESGSYHVISCLNVDNLWIAGFTIRGGNADGRFGDDDSGGGIFCDSGAPLIFQNTVTGNYAGDGGAVYCRNVSGAVISGNTIQANTADYGGGVHCCENSALTIENNTIEGNAAGRGGGAIYCLLSSPTILSNMLLGNSGGGIFLLESSATINGNMIADNSAGGFGGGVYCGSDCFPTISNNKIVRNSGERGGGIACNYHGLPTIANNIIMGNTARSWGGGLCCLYCDPIIVNNTIAENISESIAGGIYIDYCDGVIWNSTITGNTAKQGGGIYNEVFSYSCPSIIDCILWGNGDDLHDCSATFCCIEDPDAGEGNIHEDPMFVVGPFGDYYLDADSPCIDAGSRSAEEAGLSDKTTQADGTPDTETVDMGYHYPVP